MRYTLLLLQPLILLLLHTGLCLSLPQDAHYGGAAAQGGADYVLYVDFEDDYNNDDFQPLIAYQPLKEDPPVFVETGQHFVVGEGDSVVLNCATIKPKRKMIIKKLTKEGNEGQLFYVGDVKIHRDRRFDLINGVLNMTMLRETDQGTYACYFESHPSVRVIHTVEVMSRPNILFHSDDEYVSQGEILTLECIVEGNPEPRITWYRSEGLLPSGKQEEEGPTLMLDGINNSITGTYTCKAENLLGTAAESVSVTSETDLVTSEKVSVTSNKEQDQKIEIEKVIMQTGWDSTLKLICTSHHGSSANFRWEKDGNPIDTSLIESENGGQESTITLPLMSSEDFGIYSCITESGLNSSKSSIYIDDQPQEAKFTSEPEGSNDTRYLLTWGSESNSPVIWYMVSIRNLLGESSELNNLGMFQNPESKAVNNSYTITHELIDLIPDTEYEVHIQVNNKFKWSEESRFNFRTARTASSEENSSASIIPIAENSPVTIIPTPLPNLEWCEWPLEMVKTECFFFSNLLESEEDSRHINTWRNAQRFCEENGGNLAKPSSLNTLAEYFNERGQNTEKYWLGGRRGSEDNAMWLSGETVRPDWIFNIREADSNCLQYRPSENRLYMGSCEENYRWICEKENSAAPIVPIAENSPVTTIPTPSSNLEWCEWPLETVKMECFFFSNVLESEEDSRHTNTWKNAQRFCEENGGNLAQPSSLNTLTEYFNERGQNAEKYWLGGRRGSEDNAMWLSGQTVRPDWIFNVRESYSDCLQYRPSENRLYMGSCEENYRWICEKSDPFSQDLETNIFTEEEESDPFSQDLEANIFTEEEEPEEDICTLPELIGGCANFGDRWFFEPSESDCKLFVYGGCGGNANNFASYAQCKNYCGRQSDTNETEKFGLEVKIVDGRQDYETQPKQTVNRQHEDRISHWQQSVYEQEHGKQQYNQTQDQQLEILEQQLQQELEQQQQQQQQSKILQQQQQQIPEQQEVIQKITSNQLESQKRLKLQQKQKQNQSKNVIGEPEIRVVENAQTEQRTYEQNQNQESSKMNTSDNQGVSTTTTESVRGISLENQETSTTDKESVGEYQPLRYMCPPNFLRLGNGCYYFGSEMATWHDAHFACRDRDSQLITLETQWEDLTIRHYLNKPEFARLNRWLGGIYNWSTRRWMWGPSGEAMPYLGFLTSIPPESSRWHCVFMAPTLNYRWNHELCTTQMHFICEAPQSKIPNSEDIAYAP